MLLTNVLIILAEEIYGPYRTPQLPVVLLLNLPWLLVPIHVIYRMGRYPQPFTTRVGGEAVAAESATTGSGHVEEPHPVMTTQQ